MNIASVWQQTFDERDRPDMLLLLQDLEDSTLGLFRDGILKYFKFTCLFEWL